MVPTTPSATQWRLPLSNRRRSPSGTFNLPVGVQVRCQPERSLRLPRSLSRPRNAGPGRVLSELGRSAELTGTSVTLRNYPPCPHWRHCPRATVAGRNRAIQSSSTQAQATNGASGSKVAANTKGHRSSSAFHAGHSTQPGEGGGANDHNIVTWTQKSAHGLGVTPYSTQPLAHGELPLAVRWLPGPELSARAAITGTQVAEGSRACVSSPPLVLGRRGCFEGGDHVGDGFGGRDGRGYGFISAGCCCCCSSCGGLVGLLQ